MHILPRKTKATAKKGIHLASFLGRLIWLSVLPLIVLSLWLAVDALRSRQAQDRRQAGIIAGNFATDLDQYLAARTGALQMLANSPLIDDEARWGELYREAQSFNGFFGSHVILAGVGQPMRMLFNTRRPFGRELPPLPVPKGRAAAPLAAATGKTVVGDLFTGPVSKTPLCSIAVPVVREGKARFVLLTILESSQLQQRIDQRLLPAGWAISLLDSQGHVIAQRNSPRHQEVRAVDRVEVPSTVAPWKVLVEIPAATYQPPLVKLAIMLALGLVASTLVGVLCGSLAARRVGRGVRSLVHWEPEATCGIVEIEEAHELLEHATAARRESEERQELFIRHAPAALAMFDAQMRYLHVSQRWLRDYGLDSDVVGRSHYEIFPEIPEHWRELHRRGLNGEVLRSKGDRFVRADGAAHWIKWEIRPWRKANGDIGGIVIFSEDITGLKQAQEEIQALNEDLEIRVEQRTAELKAANQELDAFAYAVSHDLRAPLRAMIGFSQALREDCAAQLSDEGLDYLLEISTAGYRMGELVDGLLVLSRSLRGTLERRPIDVSAVAERLVRELERAEPERQVQWQVEAGLEVSGDERMIEVVLTNLLSNAWKYSAGAEPARITVRSEKRDDRSFICVEDNGAGFDMRHASRLFKPFQRLHRQDEFPGLGIGLATVQRIINRHGGAMEAEGEPGNGASFRFWLPN
ncbi:sensor histidine kinase [Geomonas edaphica]|uniref:sensor histidine kinase n=1 Tax=Geomonas edaphica TaxID=2570226 RepID=UPI0010A89F77|nr:ATP-binding protein [Geomonas edaphica]